VVDAPIISLPFTHLEMMEDARSTIAGITVRADDFIESAGGPATYTVNSPFNKTYPWNYTITRSMDHSLLQMRIQAMYGSFMFPTGLRSLLILNAPNVTEEITSQSNYPGESTREQRLAYSSPGSIAVGQTSLKSGGRSQQAWWKDILVEGRLQTINRALLGLVYQPDLNWNSLQYGFAESVFDTINMTIFDSNDTSISSTVSISVHVQPVNDAPVLSIQGMAIEKHLLTDDKLSNKPSFVAPLVTEENKPLQLPQVLLRDVDYVLLEDSYFKTFLNASKGSIKIPRYGITLEHEDDDINNNNNNNDNDNDNNNGFIIARSIHFRAPQSITNQILASMTYIPDDHYFGVNEKLLIQVEDLGTFGLGGVKFGKLEIPIQVLPKNSPPEILIPEQFGGDALISLDEGDFVKLSGASYYPSSHALNLSYTWQTGYELWRFQEPKVI
jgi:hypothetical protein